jgi:hypothetical protein
MDRTFAVRVEPGDARPREISLRFDSSALAKVARTPGPDRGERSFRKRSGHLPFSRPFIGYSMFGSSDLTAGI